MRRCEITQRHIRWIRTVPNDRRETEDIVGVSCRDVDSERVHSNPRRIHTECDTTNAFFVIVIGQNRNQDSSTLIIVRPTRQSVGEDVARTRLLVDNEVDISEKRQPARHALSEMGALCRCAQTGIVGAECERLLSKQVDAKLDGCISHSQQLLVVRIIVAFNWIQLTRLITDYSLSAFAVMLHESTSNREITRVADHVEWFRVIWWRQHWRYRKSSLDLVKSILVLLSPRPCRVLLQQLRQWVNHSSKFLGVMMEVVG